MNNIRRSLFYPSRGFTIVEVVVVIVIVGILAGLGGAVYTNYRERSQNETRASRAQLIATGLERFHSAHNIYPSIPMMTAKGSGNTPQAIADMLGIDTDDIFSPGAPDSLAIDIVDYNDYSTSIDNVFRYRGLASGGNMPECTTNTALFNPAGGSGFCEGFVLSYRDTISNEWKEIRSTRGSALH